ncbi:TIGR02678 family protein [Dactylosporangium sp. CA-139066]|uniref:TIGR02678 family protein n=1 Tax=Dactylosporangium sp. CA-139066 TaxID=3239930 RepID=UPI003D8C6600
MSSRNLATANQSARERVDAARALLANPLLTAAQSEELALVRLHAPALRGTFKTLLGYNLIIESSFARLVKGPISPDGPARPARRSDSSAWTPVTYTHLALLCAALLAPGTGEQTLISALIDQVRSDAATIGVDIGDTLPERRALVTAVGHLIDWGVLTETDGTATGWSERQDEALLTIHRAVLPHLLARPLSGLAHSDDLLAGDPALADQPRRSLRRKLVENPLVRREDLTDGERDVLSRERSELTRMLDEHFGLTVEVRAEGVLAYDPGGSLTDIAFPGTGTVKQAALLLLAELIDSGQLPGRKTKADLGIAAEWGEVDDALEKLTDRHRRAWGSALVEQPLRLRDGVVALLVDMSLATADDTGLVVHPAAARYRPQPVAAPATRAARRLAGQDELEFG